MPSWLGMRSASPDLALSMWRRGLHARGGIRKPARPSKSQPAKQCGSTQPRPSKMPSIRRLRRGLPGRRRPHQRNPQEIATGILSLTAPSVVRWEKSERREMARRVNEYTADLVAKRPDRFGNFATLPVPDVDGALREIEHALDTLRADGVIL